MTRTVAEIMTPDPVTVERTDTAAEAARRMAATDAGSVLVLRHGIVEGIITDRDIAVGLVALGKNPSTPVTEIASDAALISVTPDTPVEEAVRLIRSRAVRRLPVTRCGRPVGVLSLGDLAIERDPGSRLADISAAGGDT